MARSEVGIKQVVIVGGGITGLSAAFHVEQEAARAGIPVRITLLEKEGRLGGKVETVRLDGFLIERGPDSFLARKMPIITLSKELGLDEEWVPTGPEANKTYVIHNDHMHPLPSGLMLGIPTQWRPFLTTPLISLAGKGRAALDLILPRPKTLADESLGRFLERRLGREVVEKLAEPLLSGIYAGDAYNLSVQATFPQFQRLEQTYGSLIIGMTRSRKKMAVSASLPLLARSSTFLSFQNGLSSLIHRLKERLGQTQVQTATEVTQVERLAQGYQLRLADESTVNADALILATPTYVTAQLLQDDELGELLASTQYVSVANVVLTFKREELNLSLQGSGFVVPKKEGYLLTACTWTSSKWPHTAPEGHVLMRAFVGRAGQEQIVHESDQQMIEIVRHELKQLTGLTSSPRYWEVNRWVKAMPQYTVGHLQRLEQLNHKLNKAYPGLFLCGAGYRGVGLPDCIEQGKEMARQAAAFLQGETVTRQV